MSRKVFLNFRNALAALAREEYFLNEKSWKRKNLITEPHLQCKDYKKIKYLIIFSEEISFVKFKEKKNQLCGSSR